MRLLLTGANGQIGRELRRSLLPLGTVIALDRAACDLARPSDVARILREAKADVIINAAAYSAVDTAEDEEALATLVNGTAVGVIAETAQRIGALLVHYSTDYVFDGAKDTPYTEEDPPHPINAYGRSKLVGDRAIEQCGAQALILRTSWVYAARGRNFLRTILGLARERDELRVVADQIGAPTWANDIADKTAAIVGLAQRERGRGAFRSGLFNLTAAGETSWFGFAQAIIDQAAERPGLLSHKPKVLPISTADYPARAARPKNSRLACERVQARFGIALADWKHALRRCMADVAQNNAS